MRTPAIGRHRPRIKRYRLWLAIGLMGWASARAAPQAVPPFLSTCQPVTAPNSIPLTDFSHLLANAHGNSATNRLASAQVLGWLNQPNTLCGGYFADPYIPGSSTVLPPLQSTPVTLSIQNGILQYNGESTLAGPVFITQPGRIVTAGEGTVIAHQGAFEQATLKGGVLLREKGQVVAGQQASVNLQNNTYRMQQVIYRLFLNNTAKNPFTGNAQPPLSAWGKASSITQPLSGMVRLRHVSYSTCPPQSRAWTLQAQRLDLDHTNGRGHAYNAVLYVAGVPVLYAPYFNFPISNQRQSGFLYPQFSFGSAGFGLGVPFYWNMAPNYDDTLTPYFYAKRGFALNNLYRYLTTTSEGALNVTVLPNDWEFRRFQQTEPTLFPANTPGITDLINANTTRSYINYKNFTQLTPEWSSRINYSRVSDDYYIQDLGNVPVVAQNQLLQQGEIEYTGDTWNLLANFQGFQTLHPVNEAVVMNQYSMLPQLLFTSHLPLHANTFNYQWLAEAVHFIASPNPGQTIPSPSGQRLHFVPELSLPLSNAMGYVTPALRFDLTQYDISEQANPFPNQITRAMPVADIDSGLFLQKNLNWWGQDYQQTLEPRVFYLYVPYRNQQDIPVFDSALSPFSYDQLFATNRFMGSDRIGDANQVSIALTTRFINATTGQQKLSASMGIIRYFADRRVTLCSTLDCVDSPYAVGSTSTTEPVSPIVGRIQYNFNQAWNGTLNAAWDPNNGQGQNVLLNLQYIPAPNHVINVGYNYIRYGDFYTLPSSAQMHGLVNTNVLSTTPSGNQYNLSEPAVSFIWPLTPAWQLLGSWSYSWNEHHAQTYFVGAGYNSCCWGLQLVLARTFDGFTPAGQPQFNTGVYVQLALKGLAKVAANDPAALLMSSIPGYQESDDGN